MANYFNFTALIIAVTTLGSMSTYFVLSYQTSWAAIIICPLYASLCNGTPSADIIIAITGNAIIHGNGGNDHIEGAFHGYNFIYGDDGNDIMIGGDHPDYLNGGAGNDKYDGGPDGDTLLEGPAIGTPSGNDLMLGSSGDDYIVGDDGADRIYGGPGKDYIFPDNERLANDFSFDFVHCGSDNDVGVFIHSSDDFASTNCERIIDFDG